MTIALSTWDLKEHGNDTLSIEECCNQTNVLCLIGLHFMLMYSGKEKWLGSDIHCCVVCGPGPTAGLLMCVGGRNGCSFLQGKRTNLETSKVDCPLILENLRTVVRVLFVLFKKWEK